MRLLYLSCHAILEYDELRLFEELGIDYFSLGSYVRPKYPVDGIRPALNFEPDTTLYARNLDRDHLSKDLVDQFDTVLIMHKPEWIVDNWQVLKGKRVIWRSIGQSSERVERMLAPCRKEGLEIVRYSPSEVNIPEYMGSDAMIRFYKDPDEFYGYNGFNREAITFSQNMFHRGEWCNYDLFTKIAQGLPVKIYGPNNEVSGDLNGGFLSYEDLKKKMRDSRVYIYTGTQPASYTLGFIEAFMTGIPIVGISSRYANSLNISGPTYEVDKILENGVTGYTFDDVGKLRDQVSDLLDYLPFAKKIGDMGRLRAIELFGKPTIKAEWKKFLQV